MCAFCTSKKQGRREPNVGPGPAQICRISGFVKPKIYEKNAAVWSEKRCDLQNKKKGLHRNLNGFSGQIQVISKKKRSSPEFKRFFRPNSGDLQKKRSSLSLKPTTFLKPMGPLNTMSPGVIVPPCPPSRRLC